MSGRILHIQGVDTAVAASTTRTLLQIITTANVGCEIVEFEVGRDSSDATPFTVNVLTQTTAGTSVGVTVVEEPPTIGGSIQTTALSTFSGTEPTSGTVRWSIPVQQRYAYRGSIFASPGTRLAISVTTESAPASSNYICRIKARE